MRENTHPQPHAPHSSLLLLLLRPRSPRSPAVDCYSSTASPLHLCFYPPPVAAASPPASSPLPDLGDLDCQAEEERRRGMVGSYGSARELEVLSPAAPHAFSASSTAPPSSPPPRSQRVAAQGGGARARGRAGSSDCTLGGLPAPLCRGRRGMGLAAVAWGSWIHESSCSGSPRMDSEFQGLRHGNGAFQVTLSDEQTQVATLEGDDLPGSVEDNSTKLHSTITGASFRISVFEQMPATLLIKGSLLNKSLSASRLLGRGGEKERDGGILWKGARGAQVGVAVDGTPASSSWKCPLLLVFNASGSCVDLFVRALVACAAVHATATSLPFPRGEGQTLEHMDVQRDYVLIGPSRRKHMPRNFSQINLSTRLVLLDGGRIIHLTKYRMMVISNMRLLKHLLYSSSTGRGCGKRGVSATTRSQEREKNLWFKQQEDSQPK